MTEQVEVTQNETEAPKLTAQDIVTDTLAAIRANLISPDDARNVLYILAAEILINAIKVPGIVGNLRDANGNMIEVEINATLFEKKVIAAEPIVDAK